MAADAIRLPSAQQWRAPIIAQDPAIRSRGGVLLGDVQLQREDCGDGPEGARVYVVDYDATGRHFYAPATLPDFGDARATTEYAKKLADPDKLARDPSLHAINAYVTVMSVLERFENALGRRIGWGASGHRIQVAPHAFSEANAYYAEDQRALLFGYFPEGSKGTNVFTCLSHDVVAHESTHGLLDNLRTRYTDPASSPDQDAFHEGFADLVALLSVFSMRDVVTALLVKHDNKPVREADFDKAWLHGSPLFAMAEQFARALQGTPHRGALRMALLLKPAKNLLEKDEFKEAHDRANVLVAAVLRSFVEMWKRAVFGRPKVRGHVSSASPDVVVTEGCELADRMLTMLIRAIDYAPVVDIGFGDFLTALVTADREAVPQDDKYEARPTFIRNFAAFGIAPEGTSQALWTPPDDKKLRYTNIHPSVLRDDPNEVFRFIWENREELGINRDAYTRVQSVRPCLRRGPDGFWLHETVCEYVQTLRLPAKDLGRVKLLSDGNGKAKPLKRPAGLDDDKQITLTGGGVLLFDETGRLKYHVRNRVLSPRQQSRLDALAAGDRAGASSATKGHFARMHLAAATRWGRRREESW